MLATGVSFFCLFVNCLVLFSTYSQLILEALIYFVFLALAILKPSLKAVTRAEKAEALLQAFGQALVCAGLQMCLRLCEEIFLTYKKHNVFAVYPFHLNTS